VLAEIEAMQPYNRKHPTFFPLLGLLREFDDADKHRLLQLTVTQAIQWEFHNITGLSAESGRFRCIPHDAWDLKDGTEVATLVTDGPTPNLDFDKFALKLGVVVGHEAGPSGTTHTLVHDMEHILALEVATAIDRVVAAVK
jgi:hypothetical protein